MGLSDQEILHRMALLHVDGIGNARAKKIVKELGSAIEAFSKANVSKIESYFGKQIARKLSSFSNFSKAKKELEFIKKNEVQFLTFDQDTYPVKLNRAADAPYCLYYKGNSAIYNTKVIAIIGTRACSDYGKKMCEEIIAGLAPHNPVIVSGLAYGIDSHAHRVAMQHNLNTVGVMATGLDTVYPAQNKKLAKQMIEQGGLLTEFGSGTSPDRENFPTRNRIVAGMCDAVIVIETPKKGGSMITADLAYSYNRDVFCVPGRVGDKRSEGCNYLVKTLRANLITSATDVLYNLNWDKDLHIEHTQRKLFVELSEEERILYNFLQQQEIIHIDALFVHIDVTMSTLSTLLLQLEMQGLVRSLPGKQYQAV